MSDKDIQSIYKALATIQAQISSLSSKVVTHDAKLEEALSPIRWIKTTVKIVGSIGVIVGVIIGIKELV